MTWLEASKSLSFSFALSLLIAFSFLCSFPFAYLSASFRLLRSDESSFPPFSSLCEGPLRTLRSLLHSIDLLYLMGKTSEPQEGHRNAEQAL